MRPAVLAHSKGPGGRFQMHFSSSTDRTLAPLFRSTAGLGTRRGETMTNYVSAFFYFTRLQNLEQIKADLERTALDLGIRGLLILGPEGINTTCAAESLEALDSYKTWIKKYFNAEAIVFKDSRSDRPPFRRYKVKIREEIVTTGLPGVMPPEGKNHHLSPEEWNRVLKEESDFVMIDTRNWYEFKIGTFKGALNPDIEKFTDFPEYIEKQGISKEKKMLIFCTGGIRCEKGILELQNQGYRDVYQLEGGILNYLEKFPNDRFEGECFVFDHRVAVDQNLAPSKQYVLCPHCGQPGDTKVVCKRCDHEDRICESCAGIESKQDTCSKNCAHQWELNPGKKGHRQLLPFELEHKVRTGAAALDATIAVTRKKVTRINEQGQAVTVNSCNT